MLLVTPKKRFFHNSGILEIYRETKMLQADKLDQLYNHCLTEIGGDQNPDIHNYLFHRPKTINRQDFFDKTVWAIWVAGLGRNSTRSFLNRAIETGLPLTKAGNLDLYEVSDWSDFQIDRFMHRLHGYPVKARAEQKWLAVFEIARYLSEFPSETDFRKTFFAGKTVSADLDKSDVQSLSRMKLPFVRSANAHYIVRLIGGEAIKCDRWIEKFITWLSTTLEELEDTVDQLGIPLGKFDLVIWAFCEEFIGAVSEFGSQFDSTFGDLRFE